MKKIKNYLIHLLGGQTNEEFVQAYKNGRIDAFTMVQDYLKSLNGLNADEWCNKAWTFVDNSVNNWK